jgi:hypothetical protein
MTIAVRSHHGSKRSRHSARLVRWQSSNHLLHLGISVNPEALVLGDACQLDVLAVQLLLHDLLQRLEHQHLRLGQSERLVELVLQLCLCALGTRSNGFGIVAVEGTGGFGMVPTQSLATFPSSMYLVQHTDSGHPHRIRQSATPHQTADS